MRGNRKSLSIGLLVLVFLGACGRQTVTQSLLSGNQTLSQTIEVAGERVDNDHIASVMVATNQPNLTAQTNITRYAGRSLSGLAASVPAEKLLSPYAEKVAYTMSMEDGPNCWHTSIASLFHKWSERRYMHNTEFSCHVTTWFREIQDPKLGDLIRFLDADGEELHGATFIGVDKESQEAVVFTKNGYSKSEGWGFMTFADLKKVYSEVKSVRFYTPVQEALEPVKDGMKCRSEYLESTSNHF